METVCLKMEESLASGIDKSMKDHSYSTRTEFIRDAIRSKISELEKDAALRRLAAMKGALKGKARMSDEEAGEVAIARIAKKLGVALD